MRIRFRVGVGVRVRGLGFGFGFRLGFGRCVSRVKIRVRVTIRVWVNLRVRLWIRVRFRLRVKGVWVPYPSFPLCLTLSRSDGARAESDQTADGAVKDGGRGPPVHRRRDPPHRQHRLRGQRPGREHRYPT